MYLINLLHRADESQKGRNSCPGLQPCFIGSGRVGVSQSLFFHIVSAWLCCFTVRSLAVLSFASRDVFIQIVRSLHVSWGQKKGRKENVKYKNR